MFTLSHRQAQIKMSKLQGWVQIGLKLWTSSYIPHCVHKFSPISSFFCNEILPLNKQWQHKKKKKNSLLLSLWPVLFVSVTNCLTHSKESYSAINPHTQSDGMHCNKHTHTRSCTRQTRRDRHIEKCQRENGIPYCWFWTSWRLCTASCSSALCRLSVQALPPSPLITHSSATRPHTYRPVFSSSSSLSLSPHTHVSLESCPLTLSLTCAHTR